MYGLINMAIKQLVVDHYGESGWSKVLGQAKIPQTTFEMLSVYDDQITYQLVGGACEVTGKSAEEILELFGSYWVEYSSKAGYEPLLKMFGPTFRECIINLNRMHEHMGAMMPGLVPPEFEIESEISNQEFTLIYRSQREGLAPMVTGLLKGLANRYQVKVEVKYLGKASNQKDNRFWIKWN